MNDMIELLFEKEFVLIKQNLCPFCKIEININDFKDELSKKEFRISGLCQDCQDSFFK